MRSLKNLFILAVVTLAFGIITSSAQVTVTGSTGANASYTTLKGAFDAINAAGTQAGNNILVDISASTTETATASLNASDWTTLTVRPSAVATVTGNIIGAVIKLNGADNVTIDGRIGGVGSSRDLTVTNPSTSAATAAIWLASVIAGNGASNNVVRNLEIATGIDPTNTGNSTFGIIMCGTTISSTSNGVDNDNNSFTFNRIIRARYGIVTRGTTTDLNINPVVTDNIIGPSAFGLDQISKAGIFMQADTGALVSRNTVQFVGCLDSQLCTGADRVGIGIGSESWSMTPGTLTSNTYTVTKNIIHDVNEENTFSALGINLGTTNGGAATNNIVANNFIYNIFANSTTGDQVVGIGIAGGHTDRVVHNSIRIAGDMDSGVIAATTNFGSGIRVGNANGTTHLNLTLQNNSIFMDASSSSTATNRYYAISGNSAAYAFGTGGENRNNYFINPANTQLQTGGLGTVAGNTLTTQFATLANWQTAYTAPQDANSIQIDPLYLSATNLHIASISPNESAGLLIAGVTDDIDGDARGGATDIGADEITLAGPGTIQFSSGTYASNEGTTVTITVNRVSGITGAVSVDYATSMGTATAGTCGAGGDYVAASGTLNWANGDNASKTFTIPLCTDLVADPSETVVLTLSNPVGTTITGTNPATLTIGDVAPPFNGAYTVGGGGQYPSLTNAGGIFEAINLAGATGPITINIISDLTGETGAVALNPIAGNPTVLIKPSGAPRTISGVAPIAVIRINGADNVRIDGDTTASFVGGNPAIRQLTVQNLSTSATSAVILIGSATESSNNNTVKNVNVIGSLDTVVVTNPITLIGISVGGATPSVSTVTSTFQNNNTRIENCSIQKTVVGITSYGVSQATPNTGTVITQNDMTGTGNNRIKRVGIFIDNDNGGQVTENYIGGINNTGESADAVGIGAGSQGITDATVTTTIGVQNMLIARNKINGVSQDATFSAVGIIIAGVSGATNTIANNMISGVISDGDLGDFTTGIFVTGVTGAINRLYYNTVSMTGDRSALLTPATDMNPSFALSMSGTDPIVELRNNIFYTTQTASTGGADATSYAIGTNSVTFANLDSDYNGFFSTGANDGGFRSGSLDRAVDATTETDYATVALWSAAVSDDANSVIIGEVDPMFFNPVSNPRLPSTSPVVDKGIAVSVLDDIDGQTRSVVGIAGEPLRVGGIPDLGADEYTAPTAAGASIRGRLLTPTGRGLMNAFVILTNTNTGEVRTARSTSLGYFNIPDLQTGDFYIINVNSKRYQFNSQSFTLTENIDDLVLTGQ